MIPIIYILLNYHTSSTTSCFQITSAPCSRRYNRSIRKNNHVHASSPSQHVTADPIRSLSNPIHELEADISSVEPYVGPLFQHDLSNMEGGITISELATQILVGPSQVALGQLGLYMSLEDSSTFVDGTTDMDPVEHVLLPRGTPVCGYARGYFTDVYRGDKSVGYLYDGSTRSFAVFYEKQLMTLHDAMQRFVEKSGISWTDENQSRNDILCGHFVTHDSVRSDPNFTARIFVPDDDSNLKENELFSVSRLGIYANDFAFDPSCHDSDNYYARSEMNNVLDIVWRLADGAVKEENVGVLDEPLGRTTLLVPTWPVVITRKDVRLVNYAPMEVGLQYGFKYWESYSEKQKASIP